ncbi:MAG: glycosyltransferase [Deltaproteobacteria bacterium]|nr:glycosyltransferase [Deltaproteobacteria bacterium]
MRIAIVYDCLYPYTVGGAERRYRSVGAQLARRHAVTFVTRRQWRRGAVLDLPRGTRAVAVSGGRRLYHRSGRRRIGPPLRFGLGVFWYLLRHRREFDIVHACSFPFFSLLAARLACAAGGPAVVADWYEVWTARYWREYLGRLGGRIGHAVQSLCIRASGPAFVFSSLHAARLRAAGYRGEPVLLQGAYDGPTALRPPHGRREPLVVYVGRHIAEKRVAAIPAAIAAARTRIPGLRAVIFGDGPERPRVLAEIDRLGLGAVVECPGFVGWARVDAALRGALCLVLPSRREGLGVGVVEALARSTPAVVARGADSAASELIDAQQNGIVADSAEPAVLADAIVAVHAAGPDLVARTAAWFAANATRLTVDGSIGEVEAMYSAALAARARPRDTVASPTLGRSNQADEALAAESLAGDRRAS